MQISNALFLLTYLPGFSGHHELHGHRVIHGVGQNHK